MGVLQYDNRKVFYDGVGSKIEDNQLDSILKTSGLDYVVEKRQLYYEDGVEAEGVYSTSAVIDGKRVTLGSVGGQYTPVQNNEAFAFLQDMLGNDSIHVQHAGPSKNGKRAYIVAKTDRIKVMDDEVDPYITFINSHDGSSGVKVVFTPVRVWCSNCENMALRKSQFKIQLRHSTNVHSQLYISASVLMKQDEYLKDYADEMEKLATMRLTRRQFVDNVVTAILRHRGFLQEDGTPKERKRNAELVEVHREYLINAWNALDLNNYSNSAYNAIQAITDYESHIAPAKNANNPEIYFSRAINGMVLSTWALEYIKSMGLSKINY